MTADRITALQAQFDAMSRRIDNCCLRQGHGGTKKSLESLLAMLQARRVAHALLKALFEEATEGVMLRSAYLDAVHAAHTGDFPTAH